MVKGRKALAILLLLGLVAFAAPSRAAVEEDEYEDPDGPAEPSAFLLVRRKLSVDAPVSGKVATVQVDIYNSGDATATKVEIAEDNWPADAFFTEGKLGTAFDSIAPGVTETFSYSITPKFPLPRYEQRPTLVTYTPTDGESPVTTSSAPLIFAIVSSTDVLISKALKVGSVISLGMLNTQKEWTRFVAIVGGAGLVYLVLSMYRAAAKTRKESIRRKNLREFGVEEDSKTK